VAGFQLVRGEGWMSASILAATWRRIWGAKLESRSTGLRVDVYWALPVRNLYAAQLRVEGICGSPAGTRMVACWVVVSAGGTSDRFMSNGAGLPATHLTRLVAPPQQCVDFPCQDKTAGLAVVASSPTSRPCPGPIDSRPFDSSAIRLHVIVPKVVRMEPSRRRRNRTTPAIGEKKPTRFLQPY